MSIQYVAFIVGIIVGALILLAVGRTFVRRGTLGAGGSLLSVIGLVLVGLCLWSSIEIKAGDLSLKLNRTIDQVVAVTEQVEVLAKSTETARQQMLEITTALDQPQGARPERVAEIRRKLTATPVVDPRKLAITKDALLNLKQGKPVPRAQ
jgi:hypothetical protein